MTVGFVVSTMASAPTICSDKQQLVRYKTGLDYLHYISTTPDEAFLCKELQRVLDLTITVETQTPTQFNTRVSKTIHDNPNKTLYNHRVLLFAALVTMDSMAQSRSVTPEQLKPAETLILDFLNGKQAEMGIAGLSRRLRDCYAFS